MIDRVRRAALAAAAAAGALAVVTACGNPAPQPAPEHAGHAAPAQAGDMHETMPGMHGDMPGMHGAGSHADMHGGGGLTLWAVQKAGGKVLVTDGDGRPLYRSDADRAAPPRSACTAGCAAEWEPVVPTAGQAPELLGVARSQVGTLRRADGTTQLTLAGWPLYRHRGELGAQPDTRAFAGRGWYVVDPRGGKVTG